MSIYQSDSRCTACKNWVTVYVNATDRPTKDASFQFTCVCQRVVGGTGGTFAAARHIPFGAIVADLVPA
ncbi:MAG: hypothetical protein WD875_03155 [Pirellulales bacterium]